VKPDCLIIAVVLRPVPFLLLLLLLVLMPGEQAASLEKEELLETGPVKHLQNATNRSDLYLHVG
jgi:hypothetical protein